MTVACPTKETALRCFYENADANQDARISTNELSSAIYSRLPWWKKTAFKVFGGLERILMDCDQNKDNYLTQEEAYSMKQCLNTCFKRTQTIDLFDC